MMTHEQRRKWFWWASVIMFLNAVAMTLWIWIPVATWMRIVQCVVGLAITAIAVWDVIMLRRKARMEKRPFALHYVLDEKHHVIPEPDLMTWARWFETADRIVKQDQIGPYFVSTVFIGLDHRWIGTGKMPPLVFETMVFIGPEAARDYEGKMQERCSTWDEALAQHESIATAIRRSVTN